MSSHIDKILKVKGSSTSLSPPILFGKEITYSPSCRGYILWLARTHKDKNPDALIEFAKHSKLPIYVMGHLSLDYNLNNENIITLGQMVGLRKREILSNATALLYTVDPDWNEAGGIAISEALACGVPVLGQLSKTKSPLSDKVRNGIDGFVSKSPKELALKVEEVKDLNRQNIRSHWWPKLNPKSVIKSRLKVATSLFIENKGN